jgi:predicted GIY-YIG superfamily endonuclease
MHYVYFLKTATLQGSYVGYTSDLRRRLKEHHEKNPQLIYYEAYRDERDARDREQKLKQRGQAIRRLKERLQYNLSK